MRDAGLCPGVSVQAKPKQRKVGSRTKRVRFRFLATNRGDFASGRVRLCAQVPKRRVKIEGKRCVARQNIPAGKKGARAVKVKIKNPARGKVTKIKLTARGPNVQIRKTTARLRVQR